MTNPDDSLLKMRRSILIKAPPSAVWARFESAAAMATWWGLAKDKPQAASGEGQIIDRYEPGLGGRIDMAVYFGEERRGYGGPIVTFEKDREFTFENDWIPNQGWARPTYVTLRLTPALAGTLVELFHHGFEHVGGDVGAEFEGYEQGWGMTQLSALKQVCEA